MCMCDREYIFKHRQTFMRAFTAHAQDLLPDFLTRTPSLRDYLETGGDRVTDDGGMDGGKQEMLNSFSCSLLERLIVRREAIDIMGSPEQIKESMAGTRCSTCNYAVITYFCGASAAAAQLGENRFRLSALEEWLDHTAEPYPRAVLNFGIDTGEAEIDHVW